MALQIGFAKKDITPRIGVELCGFGPFLNRHSVGIRDRLWARAMAVRVADRTAVVITCDLIAVAPRTTKKVRALLADACGLAPEDVMICCSHTHSGPAPGTYIGWGEADPPHLETLPHRIVQAANEALGKLQPATLHHAEVPCEGIGVNREYDQNEPPLSEVLNEEWRPAKPELTDTTCHVLSARSQHGELLGFVSYFGCHPVVCCQANLHIHGDFVGVATQQVERDRDGVVGLFLQGALGDVNSCVVHKQEQESLLALDVIARRFARAVRRGIEEGDPLDVTSLTTHRREVVFTRKVWSTQEIKRRLEECEKKIEAANNGPLPDDDETRMQCVYAIALRGLLARSMRGESLSPATELHGLRLGPIALLGNPFETFQATKNDVLAQATAPIPLVTSFVNDSLGYAVDKTCAERGGYAADMVPLICGELPFANIHDELLHELLELDKALSSAPDDSRNSGC